jgi:hypothetical protein
VEECLGVSQGETVSGLRWHNGSNRNQATPNQARVQPISLPRRRRKSLFSSATERQAALTRWWHQQQAVCMHAARNPLRDIDSLALRQRKLHIDRSVGIEMCTTYTPAEHLGLY